MFAKRNSSQDPDAQRARREVVITQWERKSALPLAILAIAFMALWAVQVLVDLEPWEWDLIEGLILVIWAGFIIDFAVRFYFHADKKLFMQTNVIEFVALVLPMFRFFRMFRVLTALGFLARVMQSFQGRVTLYVAVIIPMLIFGGALGVYEAERFVPGANLTDFENSLWWAAVTLFTVGYGDHYPITREGRLVALVLMVSGWALISVMTANLAAYFAKQASLLEEKKQQLRNGK